MPQPTYAIVGGKVVCKFGGQPLPIVGTVMNYLDLNDKTNWRLQTQTIKEAHIRLHAQRPFQSRALPLSSNNGPKIVDLKEIFDESGGSTFASQKALLSQSDQQFLTFDNLTGILCKLIAFGDPKPLNTTPPYLWDIELQFICLEPFAQDLAATTVAAIGIVTPPTAAPVLAAAAAATALGAGTYTVGYTYVTASGETPLSPTASVVLTAGQQINVTAVTPLPSFATAVKWYFTVAPGGTAGFIVQNSGAAFSITTYGSGAAAPVTNPPTSFAVTYAGSVKTRPTFTLVIPSTSAGTISQIKLQNTTSGEVATVNFSPALAGATNWTFTFDCDGWHITDQNGLEYDQSGNGFPQLYPPAGQVNNFTFSATPAAGLLSGITLAASYVNRWEL